MALTSYLRAQRDAMLANAPGARSGSPDAVHDMRVAMRRLRASLRTFRPILARSGTPGVEHLHDELRWFAGVLGTVRDGDVMAGRLAEAVAAEPPELVVGPIAARIRQRLAATTQEARERLVAALESPRYAALVHAVDELVDGSPPGQATRGELLRRAHKAVRRADRRLAAADCAPDTAELRPGAADRDQKLHDARKAYKRARYAVEAVRPIAGKPARRLAKRLSELQDVLGTHQDAIVTEQLLRDYGMRAYLDGENAFTYGLLHARQHRAGERSLARLGKARRRAGLPRVRRWLG